MINPRLGQQRAITIKLHVRRCQEVTKRASRQNMKRMINQKITMKCHTQTHLHHLLYPHIRIRFLLQSGQRTPQFRRHQSCPIHCELHRLPLDPRPHSCRVSRCRLLSNRYLPLHHHHLLLLLLLLLLIQPLHYLQCDHLTTLGWLLCSVKLTGVGSSCAK